MPNDAANQNRQYRAVFFDLDGTLVPMELEDLLDPYYHIIGERAAWEGLDPTAFIRVLNEGIYAMMKNAQGCANADAFWKVFYSGIERDGLKIERDWEDFFNDFYTQGYPKIGATVEANPAAAEAIGILQEKGYPLVLATMPLFPLDAVKERLRWAGVNPDAFERITSFENSTSIKPKLEYYRENLAACGLEGADVLMVGNNTKEDLVFMELGADAFLVTDYLLDPEGFDISKVRNGSLADFAAFVKELPPCENPAGSIETELIS